MYYYLIAPLALKTPPLVYMCEQVCAIWDICDITLKNKACKGVVLSALQKPHFECKMAYKSSDYFLPYQQTLASFITHYYCVSFGESYGLFTPQSANLPPLEPICVDLPLALSKPQAEAFDFCTHHSNALLFGDTGSGKTEIYIHLIAKALSCHQSALFLMPEIALTPQIESRLRAVFGDMVGIWHSKISPKQKQQLLGKIQAGEIRILAGARSALFLPLFNLGLVIVDEEHDDAYKSQQAPRYNARDLALYLGKKTHIKVILGSATPSLTTYYHAKAQNSLYRLKGGYFSTKKHIEILPLQSQQDSLENELNHTLMTKIANTLSNKQQTIVFLPTRAHYKMLVCSACGSGCECDFCSVNMSLHFDRNALVCHYCNFCKPIPKLCPQCQKDTLRSYRMGTAQVGEILSNAFSEAKIALFDRDHITTYKKLTGTLKAFNDGDIDVLVGTQMLSKGHDYHGVNLAIILGIDYILKSSDFRANERAISLLHQIAGRSGRKYNGEVYIESANGAFLERFLQDYEDFLIYELANRPRIYPPYQRLAMLTFSHKKEHIAMDYLLQTRDFLAQLPHKDVEIIGESRALIGRLYDKYRFMILLRSPSVNALLSMLQALRANEALQGKYEIDIDPLNII